MPKQHTWVISDLHLCDTRPTVIASFLAWLESEASQVERLCILGDLFEVWLGDDAIQQGLYASVIKALKALTEQGVELLVMCGNRDFLLGKGFEQATGARLISDPMLVNWYEQSLLLTHGDALCTDDVAYQQFRAQTREMAWQNAFLARPFVDREFFAEQVRQHSKQATASKTVIMMDVNPQALEVLLKQYDYPVLIHGHTHRPHTHYFSVNGRDCQRWVLGDWHDDAQCLKITRDGIERITLNLGTLI